PQPSRRGSSRRWRSARRRCDPRLPPAAPLAAPIGVVLVAAKRTALEAIADRIRRQFGLCRKRLGAEILGAPLRAVAEAAGIGIVPPGRLVVGAAVEDLEADVGMLEPNAQELNQVLRLEPDRQPAFVDGSVADIADAQAGDAEAVFVGIIGAERLTEGLADTIAAVRTHRDVDADFLVAWIEADGVVRGSKHHAPDAAAIGGLEQVAAADDVGAEDGRPVALDRIAAEMGDAVDAGDDRLDLGVVGEVGGDELLVCRQIGGPADIAPADARVDAFQQFAQPRADLAGRAGDKDVTHSGADPCCGLGLLGSDLLITGAAVEEVPLHGGARLGGGVLFDRAQDLLVLALEDAEMEAVGGRRRGAPHGAARNNETAEIFEEPPELRVAGGIRDGAVEGEILVDREVTLLDGAFDRGVALGDLPDLG